MKRIFAGEVFEALPQPNGIVFSYCKDTSDDKVLVAYKMLSFDSGTMTDVARNIYQLSKFGSNYRAIAARCTNYVTDRALILPNGKVFVAEENGKAMLLGADGVPVWEGELLYRGFAPSDIAIYKNTLWACYAEANVLLRFNLMTLREELRIGGTKSPFRSPQDLFIEGDNAIISNPDINKLLQVNLNSYTVLDYKEFTEPVYSYMRIKDYQFVVMKSGLYLL